MSRPEEFSSFLREVRAEICRLIKAGASPEAITRRIFELEYTNTLVCNLVASVLFQWGRPIVPENYVSTVYIAIAKVHWQKYEHRSDIELFGYLRIVIIRAVFAAIRQEDRGNRSKTGEAWDQAITPGGEEAAAARRRLVKILFIASRLRAGKKRDVILDFLNCGDLKKSADRHQIQVKSLQRYLREFRELL